MSTAAMWFYCGFLLCAVAGSALPASAQALEPPAGISKEQFDALVEAIGDAVVRKLDARQAEKGAAVPLAEPAAVPGDDIEARVGEFVMRSRQAFAAFPDLIRRLIELPSLIREAGAGRSLSAFMALLLGSALAALGAERGIWAVFGTLRQRLSAQAAGHRGLTAMIPLGVLLAIDALAIGAVWLVSYGAIGLWFSRASGQDKLAAAILAGIFAWRLYMLLFRVVLRPGLSGARLADMDDEGAAAVCRRISLLILAIGSLRMVIRLLMATQAPPDVVAAGQLLASTIGVSVAIAAAAASRAPMARWFAALSQNRNERGFGRLLGQNWLYVAVPLFVFLGLTQIYGAISIRYSVPNAVLLTLNALIAVIALQTLGRYLSRPDVEAPAATEHSLPSSTPPPRRMLDVVLRCIRVAILIGVVTIVAQSWIVDVLALVDRDEWRTLARTSLATGITMFLAFVAWQFIDFVTRRHAPAVASAGPHAGEEANVGSSRLATVLPLLRVVLAVTISVLALLIVLSELGVNIGPLLAGASVFGLAISFGSQALVRDIVSGVFYLSDDAFRVGEYIDCGKAKGSVEGFTLRSIRLRHQNGQVHTIPFGQLGQITNFSRDWSTVKFNLRFKRDTDLEKLRKTVKKIGDEMQEDPEFKDEFFAPLRMQGVADILDNALLVRFKFTVRPVQPSYIQRVAVKKMVTKFAEVGIDFADSMVAVQTLASGSDTAAAAAASAVQSRSRADAALAEGPVS
ncbi:mechanosensitive ion channel family protein [Bosea sp. UC22_33]|uniref:mechanosensitive ion channel family protein n=1 Tax=Bosea sp. UC22_33 TaxID=3350165 RepID=UPI00366BD3AE